MIEICDRRIKVHQRDKTQTINICTAAGIHGVYEYIFRIYGKENFLEEADLLEKDFKSLGELINFLEGNSKGNFERSPRIEPSKIQGIININKKNEDFTSDDWLPNALSSVEKVINQFVLNFIEYPYLHRVEHSLHCDLFSRLLFAENLNQRLFLNGELMQLIHKEWPEFRPRPDKNNRRGNFDLVILSPNSLKGSNIWDFINGRIEAPIVIEMGLNYSINHLEQDFLKFNNSNVYRGYLIHLARKEFIDSFEDIEYLLLDIENKYKNIKTAYANIENDSIKYKLLNNCKILKK